MSDKQYTPAQQARLDFGKVWQLADVTAIGKYPTPYYCGMGVPPRTPREQAPERWVCIVASGMVKMPENATEEYKTAYREAFMRNYNSYPWEIGAQSTPYNKFAHEYLADRFNIPKRGAWRKNLAETLFNLALEISNTPDKQTPLTMPPNGNPYHEEGIDKRVKRHIQ